MTLTEQQKEIIKHIRQNTKCTEDDLSEKLKYSKVFIIRSIHVLIAKGAIFWDKTFQRGHKVFVRIDNIA